MIFIASASYVIIEFNHLLKDSYSDAEFNRLMENNKGRRLLCAFMSVVSVFFMSSVL